MAVLGGAAACLAAVAHEAVGHGLTCLAEGGRVTLLTATHFACDGGGVPTDVGGPLGNLVLGVTALLLAKHVRGAAARYFLALLAAFNLCWFAAEFIYSPLTGMGDQWAVARQLGLGRMWWVGSLIAGFACYAAAVTALPGVFRRLAVPGEAPGALVRRIGVGHIAATLVFTLAGALWHGSPLGSAWEAFLTIGAGALPMWRALGRARRLDGDGAPVVASWPARLAGAALILAFLLTQARGLGTAA